MSGRSPNNSADDRESSMMVTPMKEKLTEMDSEIAGVAEDGKGAGDSEEEEEDEEDEDEDEDEGEGDEEGEGVCAGAACVK